VGRACADSFFSDLVVESAYRPFFSQAYYADPLFSDRLTSNHAECFGSNFKLSPKCFALTAPGASKTFSSLATKGIADWHFLGDTQLYPLTRTVNGTDANNITDWALKQFSTHYADEIGKGKAARKITKEAIFHYCYAVLHDPLYREKYAQNLKRELPRMPLYAGFWQWAQWGEQLMALHVGYEAVAPFALARVDVPDDKARAAGQPPKPILKADPASGSIALDSETTLRGVPPEAWTYQLGNRCAIDWVLDQHKEKKPKDPTIREKFNTYRFCDYKEKVVDLLMRVTTVSVETVRITQAMKEVVR
jgi:predicted helicase